MVVGGALLEGWRRRARAVFGQLEQATSPAEAHRLRIALIDAMGALLGIESMVASHIRARTHLDPVGRAGRARLRLALLCIASSTPSDRRHVRALSTIRAELWEAGPAAFPDSSNASSVSDDFRKMEAEVSRVAAELWPLDVAHGE